MKSVDRFWQELIESSITAKIGEKDQESYESRVFTGTVKIPTTTVIL